MNTFGNCIRGEYMGISSVSSYSILCDMVAKDKMISLYLGFYDLSVEYFRFKIDAKTFDAKNGKFLVDISKMMNAIKSTNTLKEIYLPNATGKADLLIEPLLKEALGLNFSVISLISTGNCDARTRTMTSLDS